MSRKEHVDAVLARLREHPDLRDRVFEGIAVADESGNTRTRYVTVWVGTPSRDVRRYTGSQDAETYAFTLHSVSQLSSDAGDLADAVSQQLLGWTPDLPGRNCRRMTAGPSVEMQYDRDLTPPLYWLADVFDLTSEPLPEATA